VALEASISVPTGSVTTSGSVAALSFRLEEKMSELPASKSGVTWTISSLDASSLDSSPAEPAGCSDSGVVLPRLARFLLLMEQTA
jgi:hypothetical protein